MLSPLAFLFFSPQGFLGPLAFLFFTLGAAEDRNPFLVAPAQPGIRVVFVSPFPKAQTQLRFRKPGRANCGSREPGRVGLAVRSAPAQSL